MLDSPLVVPSQVDEEGGGQPAVMPGGMQTCKACETWKACEACKACEASHPSQALQAFVDWPAILDAQCIWNPMYHEHIVQ